MLIQLYSTEKIGSSQTCNQHNPQREPVLVVGSLKPYAWTNTISQDNVDKILTFRRVSKRGSNEV